MCEIAEVQPYVLRTWEAEFADLGTAKAAGGPRLYRRGDVERVLRIKHLLFVDGLTIAGVRRRLSEEMPTVAPEPIVEGEWVEAVDVALRERLRDVRGGLQSLLSILSNAPREAGSRGADRATSNGRGRVAGKPPAKATKGSKSAGAKPKAAAARKAAASKARSKPAPRSRPTPAKAKTKAKRAVGGKKR